jgi:hypothetical protein
MSRDAAAPVAQESEAPALAVEEPPGEAVAEAATAVVQKPALPEEPIEEKALPLAAEEPAGEAALEGAPVEEAPQESNAEAARGPDRETADEAKSPALELEMDAEGTEMPLRESLSAEEAVGMGASPTSEPGGGGGAEPTPLPPTTEPPPTATVRTDAPEDDWLAEDEQAPAESEVSRAPTDSPIAPDSESLREDPVQDPQSLQYPWEMAARSSLSTLPWRSLQVGLGSAAILLLAATLWAWRSRR